MTEDFLYKTPDSFRLIRILFGILIGVFLVGLVLIYVLEINQVSKADSGVLIASDKPREYLANSNVEVEKLYVQEGDKVNVGDTIAQLSSNKLLGDLYRQRNEIMIEEQRIKGLGATVDWSKQQLLQTKRNRSKLSASLASDKTSKSIGLQNLRDQVVIAKTKLEQLRKRLDLESELLVKGAISEIDFQKKQQQFFQERNDLIRLQGRYDQQELELENIDNDQDRDIGRQNLSVLNLQAEIEEKEKQMEEAELTLFQKRQVENALMLEIENLTIKSEIDGYITTLYNQISEVNRIDKGRLIAKVTPLGSSQYYCKLVVGEEALRGVLPGQDVNIKLDAYNHYQYGVLKGKVINIDKEIVDNIPRFYVLTSIELYNKEVFRLKDGFKVSGEVILGTVKLNQYIYPRRYSKK